MRKKLTCIDISKLLELKKMLLEEKFLKISTTFFLIFDPVCISIFNNYISKDVNELYLLLRFVMMFYALFNLFLFYCFLCVFNKFVLYFFLGTGGDLVQESLETHWLRWWCTKSIEEIASENTEDWWNKDRKRI